MCNIGLNYNSFSSASTSSIVSPVFSAITDSTQISYLHRYKYEFQNEQCSNNSNDYILLLVFAGK